MEIQTEKVARRMEGMENIIEIVRTLKY